MFHSSKLVGVCLENTVFYLLLRTLVGQDVCQKKSRDESSFFVFSILGSSKVRCDPMMMFGVPKNTKTSKPLRFHTAPKSQGAGRLNI